MCTSENKWYRNEIFYIEIFFKLTGSKNTRIFITNKLNHNFFICANNNNKNLIEWNLASNSVNDWHIGLPYEPKQNFHRILELQHNKSQVMLYDCILFWDLHSREKNGTLESPQKYDNLANATRKFEQLSCRTVN